MKTKYFYTYKNADTNKAKETPIKPDKTKKEKKRPGNISMTLDVFSFFSATLKDLIKSITILFILIKQKYKTKNGKTINRRNQE